MYFSIIIPVYNRPDEIKELLQSLTQLNFNEKYEVVIVEDGSIDKCENIANYFKNQLDISYYFKENSGPGDSRNFGMSKAKGDYFIIFDSDCIIPEQYLNEVKEALMHNYIDCFGGPDTASKRFSSIQKAINFAMTSFITTGGIRGGSEKIEQFQPRSFNMGLSKIAFQKSGGFGNIHPGEDPDLSIRLWKLGFETKLFTKAFVYHKRRIDWEKFYSQVNKFGKARPILDHWYPEYSRLTFLFPSLFVIGFFASMILLFLGYDIFLKLYFIYFTLIFIISSIQNKNIYVGFLSIRAVCVQFFGYGLGFLYSFYKVHLKKIEPKVAFPELFFDKKNRVFNNEVVIIQKIKTKIIGLTGGIGSGKTTVANIFAELGIPVYISDTEGKKVMQNPEIIAKIAGVFGHDILDGDILNREKIASIVFNDKRKLEQLNAIVHPEVKKHFDNWVDENKQSSIVIKESAILFETGSDKDCFKTISITAPLETRIQRVLQRDETTREAVTKRINNQLSDEERNSKSDYIIENIDMNSLKKQIEEIVNKLQNY